MNRSRARDLFDLDDGIVDLRSVEDSIDRSIRECTIDDHHMTVPVAIELMHHVGRRSSRIELIGGAGEHVLRTPADPSVIDRLGLRNES